MRVVDDLHTEHLTKSAMCYTEAKLLSSINFPSFPSNVIFIKKAALEGLSKMGLSPIHCKERKGPWHSVVCADNLQSMHWLLA